LGALLAVWYSHYSVGLAIARSRVRSCPWLLCISACHPSRVG